MIRALLSTILTSALLAPSALAGSHSWDSIHPRANLYLIREDDMKMHRDIQKLNFQVLQEIESFRPKSSHRSPDMTQVQAQAVLDFTKIHPVAGEAARHYYDPTCRLGFCFGRSLFTHLELLRRGIEKSSIMKAFVVGPMDPTTVNWQFHVATLVQAHNAKTWYALDTHVGRAVPVATWFAEMNKLSTDGKLRLFVTYPNKIGPSAWEYNIAPFGLFDPGYNKYFEDMFKSFKENPAPESLKIKNSCAPVFSRVY